MKLYRVHNEYSGNMRWEPTIERANFVASLWVSELEMKGHEDFAENWVKIDELNNKTEILNLLNINNPI